jgi:Fe-S oxidoreductase
VQQLLNDQRNRRLRAVLRATVGLLNRAGIAPVLLKGAIPLLPEQYPLAFARMLGDLDLAVAPRCESA